MTKGYGPKYTPRLFFIVISLIAQVNCSGMLDEKPWSGKAKDFGISMAVPMAKWPKNIKGLKFGIIPYLGSGYMHASFAALCRYLSKRLEVPVELVVARDYDDLIQSIVNQEIDLAALTPLAYVRAKDMDPALKLLAMELSEGQSTYLGYVLVREKSSIRYLTDLVGKVFCYVDPESTSGYLYPRALFIQNGFDPDTMFSKTYFSGNHVKCIEDVVDGTADAACVYSGAISVARTKGIPLYMLHVLAKTDRIPQGALCARSELSQAAAERLKQEFLQISSIGPGALAFLTGEIRVSAWSPAEDSDYDSVRAAIRLATAKNSGDHPH